MDTLKCANPSCEKNSTMACPTCKKLNVPTSLSVFCSQVCFKDYWPSHKAIHKLISSGSGSSLKENPTLDDPFAGYTYTGKLRAGKVSKTRLVPDHIQKPEYWKTGIPVTEERASRDKTIPVYSKEAIEGIRAACRAGREVLDIAGRSIVVGMTTDDIDAIVHQACIERDCYPSPLNYYHFPKSLCTSLNEVICHGIPDSTVIQDGDILNLDISVYKNGYHGDLNDTFLVGNVKPDVVRLVRTAFNCLKAALEMVKPGTMYRDLGKTITGVANAEGFSVVKTYCGHGIGTLFHTLPNVPHYPKNKAIGIMKPGHIFTIEPMINMGSWRDETWPDHWTAVTVDGKYSAQFEHTILVTDTGYEILTARDNEPVMQWDLAKVQRPILQQQSHNSSSPQPKTKKDDHSSSPLKNPNPNP